MAKENTRKGMGIFKKALIAGTMGLTGLLSTGCGVNTRPQLSVGGIYTQGAGQEYSPELNARVGLVFEGEGSDGKGLSGRAELGYFHSEAQNGPANIESHNLTLGADAIYTFDGFRAGFGDKPNNPNSGIAIRPYFTLGPRVFLHDSTIDIPAFGVHDKKSGATGAARFGAGFKIGDMHIEAGYNHLFDSDNADWALEFGTGWTF